MCVCRVLRFVCVWRVFGVRCVRSVFWVWVGLGIWRLFLSFFFGESLALHGSTYTNLIF